MEIIRNRSINWWMSIFFSFLLLLIIGIFSYIKTDFLFKGITIEATIHNSPDSSLVEVKGNAKNAVYLSLNDREIFIDKEGNFSELLIPLPGFSTITLRAVDKFDREKNKEFKITNKESVEAIKIPDEIQNTNSVEATTPIEEITN